MKREYNFTQMGKIVTMFLTQLLRDKNVDLNKPMTDTYLFEVGYEMELSALQILSVYNTIANNGTMVKTFIVSISLSPTHYETKELDSVFWDEKTKTLNIVDLIDCNGQLYIDRCVPLLKSKLDDKLKSESDIVSLELAYMFISSLSITEKDDLPLVVNRLLGNKQYGGVRQYIPLKVNAAGVMPIIFAQAIMFIPAAVSGLAKESDTAQSLAGMFNDPFGLVYNIVFALFCSAIMGFSLLYWGNGCFT